MINNTIQKAKIKITEEVKKGKFTLDEPLPVVEKFCKTNLKKDKFKDMDILYIQHILSPFISRLKLMEKYGNGDFDNWWFVDIPYSTSSIVKNEIAKFCKKENFASEYNDALVPYAITQENRVKEILVKISKNNRKLLIVDDGAYAVRTLAHMEKDNPEFVKKICSRGVSIVEQTTRGHRIFEKEEEGSEFYLNFIKRNNISVISIARTKTKMQTESPFIGIAVSNAISIKIEEFQGKHKILDKILVLGFGAVGQATVNALQEKNIAKEIHVSEPESNFTDAINKLNAKQVPKLGESFFDEKINQDYDAVIGCTGYGPFFPKDVKILNDGAVLASGSSAAVEFNRSKFLEKAMNSNSGFSITNKDEIIQNGIHATIEMEKNGKKFHLSMQDFLQTLMEKLNVYHQRSYNLHMHY